MALIRVLCVLTVWLFITSCSTATQTLMIVDVNGTKHFHTLSRVTNIGESVKFCELHNTWEYISKKWRIVVVAAVSVKMANAISEDAQIHISVAFLIKAMVAVAVVTGSWYQAQMKFAEQERRIKDLEDKVLVLNASVEGMETQHIEKLEEENKSLMQRLGIKR